MFLLDFSTGSVEVLNKGIKRGDRVRVIKGPLLGLEVGTFKKSQACNYSFGWRGFYRYFLYSKFVS